jgi:hypothetical protein
MTKHEPLSELDHPFYEVYENVNDILEKNPGAEVFFKFTCENCMTRQTFDIPNTLYKEGKCEECGHVTNLERRGCNFLLHVSVRKEA